ncbi:MAG: PD-(D/E)XK nuclease family protein [Clostridia bacterium]|nr:PD-(D/E)XK nuclease family protein [Clostridia bacterium]
MLKFYACKTYAEAIGKAGECAAAFGKDPARKMFAFCEDKLTMSLETEVARACGGGTFNVQVTSFSRFIRRFSREKGDVLDRESSAMVVKNILLSGAENLACFKRSAFNAGTAVSLYELIAQLKSAGVTPSDLSAGAAMGGALAGKIKDIVYIYNEYENYIAAEGLFDSNSYLSLMPEIIRREEFKGGAAMLVGFSSLTRQGMNIVKALAESMEEVSVFALSGDNTELYTNELKDALIREIGDFSLVESAESYGDEQNAIMKYLFEPTCFSAPKTETKKIFLYEAADHDDEITRIAALIRQAVLSGARYREIALAIGGAESYRTAVARVFADYEIPYFIDSRRTLSAHPLANLVVQYVTVIKGGYRAEDVIALEKNPYFQSDRRVSDKFENFCLKNALTAKHIKNGLNLTLSDKSDYGTDEENEIFESERNRILSFDVACRTVADFVSAAENLLEKCHAFEKAKEFSEKLRGFGNHADAAFTEQAYEKITGVLSSIKRILGGAKTTAAEFRSALTSGFSACKISVLPQLSDAVYVGDYKECKYLGHKILFAAGLNGEVPFAKSDTAILTDRDLTRLEQFNCIVEPKIRIVNRRERENVGAALLSFGDRLYLSRSATGADGKPAAKGRIFEYFTAIFSRNGRPLPVETFSDERRRARADENFLRHAVKYYGAPRPAMKEFLSGSKEFKEGRGDYLIAETTYISALQEVSPSEKERAEGLLRTSGSELATAIDGSAELIIGNDTVSASVLESYFGCPFACFMKYGLKLAEREEGEVRRNEFGNFLHGVLEDYVAVLKKQNESKEKIIYDRATSDAAVKEMLDKRKSEFRYARYLSAEKYEALFGYVEREAKRVAYAVFCQLAGSGFSPAETEAKFRDGAKYPAVKLNTSFGSKKVVGKIDRVDRCGDYVRIIDYKTGKIHDKTEEFYTGNSLQLYLYMNAFLQGGGKAGGAYYFPVNDKFSDGEENVYALRGKTLLDEEVVSATDGGLDGENDYSAVLDVKFKRKDGVLRPSANAKSLLEEKTFAAYLDYAVKIAERGCEEISEGIIAPSPYEGKCRNCAYSGVCGFEETRGNVRKEDGISDETIEEAVKE